MGKFKIELNLDNDFKLIKQGTETFEKIQIRFKP
jgi:hypothetical protein